MNVLLDEADPTGTGPPQASSRRLASWASSVGRAPVRRTGTPRGTYVRTYTFAPPRWLAARLEDAYGRDVRVLGVTIPDHRPDARASADGLEETPGCARW
jgi:hypothetical protein